MLYYWQTNLYFIFIFIFFSLSLVDILMVTNNNSFEIREKKYIGFILFSFNAQKLKERYRIKKDKSCYSNLLQLRTLKRFFFFILSFRIE